MLHADEFLSIRRDRTAPNSPEREFQVRLAKMEAARYLYLRDLRSRDQATLSYLKRNGVLKPLTNYLDEKAKAIYDSLEKNDIEMTYEEVMYEDLYLHMHKDKLTSMAKYANYRWSIFKKIRNNQPMLDALRDKIESYVEQGFHLVKPEEFVPEQGFDSTPIKRNGVSV